MIIIMKSDAVKENISAVEKQLAHYGFKTHPIFGETRTIIGAIGDKRLLSINQMLAMEGVENVVPIMRPYKLASRELKKETSIIDINGIKIGSENIVVFAGPSVIEDEEQLDIIAGNIKKSGGDILVSDIFNQGLSPYDLSPTANNSLKILKNTGKKYNMPVMTEVIDTRDVEIVSEYADILEIGSENMQNYRLLSEVGKTDKAVVLKRGLSASVEEWLMAAEYIMSEGNSKVILCETGIRTFETSINNSLDISSVAAVKELSHLPVIADPCSAAGTHKYVSSLSKAIIAAGADGLMINVHNNPEKSPGDAEKALKLHKFDNLMRELCVISEAVGKHIII